MPPSPPLCLYGHGMHDHVLRSCEVGDRAALAEDDERCGFGPLFDASYAEYMDLHHHYESDPCCPGCGFHGMPHRDCFMR